MTRALIMVAAFALVAGPSLAGRSLDASERAPLTERPMLSGDWGSRELEQPAEQELGLPLEPALGVLLQGMVADEGVQIAGKKRKSRAGKRGGAKSKSRGDFKKGNKRHAQRHAGEPGRPGKPGDPGGLRGGEPGGPGEPGDPGGLGGMNGSGIRGRLGRINL